jgi:UDP:flavonoid glycosyltransferase YjiC (YdhE family)
MADPTTIAFFPEPGAWGPTNNCAAIAEVLRSRGFRLVFVVEESFRGVLEEKGFEEALFRVGPPPEHEEQVGEGWTEWVRTNAIEFRKPTIEQLATVIEPIWRELANGAYYCHDRLLEIWDEYRPDVIVTDNVTGFPAVPTAGVPWARMISANPLEMQDAAIPPAFSGYPVDDSSGWDEFRAEYLRVHESLLAEFNAFCVDKGFRAHPEGEFQSESPWLNMYLYPREIDYVRVKPLGLTWHRLDSTVRTSERPWDVSEHLPGEGAVIYLSLGSLGSMDTGLMQRLIDVLATTEHRVIVSMGPLHARLRLGERMTGEQFLPQPSILPQCDLLITHGGNNTISEAFSFGLPTIVLPLFWDQYDNAQRAEDERFGIRLRTYEFEDTELIEGVERLLADSALRARMRAASARLQAEPGRVRGADLVERLARTGEAVTS